MATLAAHRPFAFVDEAHPFNDLVEPLRRALDDDPLGADLLAAGAPASSEIKATERDGTFVLERAYVTVTAPGSAGRTAVTAYWSERDGGPSVHRFPDDPRLRTAADALGARFGGDVAILRYVPLRRLTFLARVDGRDVVGKFKRPSRLLPSYDAVCAMAATIARHATGFATPAPAGVDTAASVFFQAAIPGRDIAALTRPETLGRWLAHVGAVQAEFHSLPTDGLPTSPSGDPLHAALRDLRWIAFHRPELTGWSHRTAELLRRTAPRDDAAPRACHGDLVCSHVFVDGDRTSVIDLDLAHAGDPHRDAAMLLASLRTDVPAAAHAGDTELGSAEDAYLTAYAARATQPLDPTRFAWWRTVAEVYYLALAFTKDTLDDRVAARRVARVARAWEEA